NRNCSKAPDPLAASAPQVPFITGQAVVISRPLPRVLQQIVGSADLLELLLSGRIASIEVWMVRFGGLAERGSDRFIVSIPRHAKNIVGRLHAWPVSGCREGPCGPAHMSYETTTRLDAPGFKKKLWAAYDTGERNKSSTHLK